MKVTLYIPGLLGVPARHIDALQLPQFPGLRRWCREATEVQVAAGRHGLIMQRLGVTRPPLAPLAWLGAHGNRPARQTFFATPVHLQAGMRDIVLFAGGALNVTADEREQIANDAASYFGKAPSIELVNDILFLQPEATLAIDTVPLHRVQGATVRQHLPTGRDAGRINSWMNELQMFLHSHEINRVRAARGRPALNGVWIWGEGELPPAAHPGTTEVHAESLALRGLGQLLGTATPMPSSARELAGDREHVVEFGACARALDADDVAAWKAAVEEVDAQWLQPLREMLNDGIVSEAVLYGGDGLARRLSRRESRWLRALRAWRSQEPQLVRES